MDTVVAVVGSFVIVFALGLAFLAGICWALSDLPKWGLHRRPGE